MTEFIISAKKYNSLTNGFKIGEAQKAVLRITIIEDSSNVEDYVKIQIFVSDMEVFRNIISISEFALKSINQLNKLYTND